MNLQSHINRMERAVNERLLAEAQEVGAWAGFSVAFRAERERRKIRLRDMARRLGITAQMLSYLETGERRWKLAKAALAVKLLTRREQWPD